ncbi:MAG: VOC family protein [Proteobacteria bacterium]|nr:VOC family protein [Pseudomonadota bacterium]
MQSLGTYSECKKYVVTLLVISYFLHLLDVLRGCVIIRVSISGFGFIIKSLSAAKEFYSENFGFGVVFENEWYLHLVSDSGIQIGFMLPEQPTQPKIFHSSYSGSGVIFSVEVNDADSAYSEAKKKGLDVVLDIRSEAGGSATSV